MAYTPDQFQAVHAEVIAAFEAAHPQHAKRESRSPEKRHAQQLAREAAAAEYGIMDRVLAILAERYPDPPEEDAP